MNCTVREAKEWTERVWHIRFTLEDPLMPVWVMCVSMYHVATIKAGVECKEMFIPTYFIAKLLFPLRGKYCAMENDCNTLRQ